MSMAALRHLARLTQSGKVPTSTSFLVTRAFSQCIISPSLLRPVLTARTCSTRITRLAGASRDGFLRRCYVTATKKKTIVKKKKTTVKRKTRAKKPIKKKARKVAKKPKKPSRPKVLDIPSPRGLSGYTVFLQSQLQSVKGVSAKDRIAEVGAAWRALSDPEKEVCPPITFSAKTNFRVDLENSCTISQCIS